MGIFKRRLAITFKDVMMSQELELGNLTPLPVCHNTTEGNLHEIQLQETITPQQCNIYQENLSYFFYGKAVYVNEPPENLLNLTDDLPITIIFELDSIGNPIHRVVAFDSGGFHRYKLKKDFKVEHFTIEKPPNEVLPKLVRNLFDSNENYLKGVLCHKIPSPLLNRCRPLRQYVDFMTQARQKGGTFGQQGMTFELQFKDNPIPFRPKAILMHHSYLSQSDWEAEIEEYAHNGIDLHPYGEPGTNAMPLNKAYEAIESKVAEIIKGMANV